MKDAAVPILDLARRQGLLRPRDVEAFGFSPEEKGVRSCKPAFERLVDPMAHEALWEVNEFLRVLETCRHPGCHRVP